MGRGVLMTNWNDPDELVMPETLAELPGLAAAGVQTIEIGLSLRQPTVASNYQYRGPITDEALRTFVKAAAALGMQVALKSMIHTDDHVPYPWMSLQPTDLDQWFANYTAWMVHYGALAESLHPHVPVLFVGTEFESLSGNHSAHWSALIRAVRGVFSGTLGYCSIVHPEMAKVVFWAELDWMGLDWYMPLTNDTAPDPLPPLASLVAQNQYFMGRVEAWRRSVGLENKTLVFAESGLPALRAGLAEPWAEAANLSVCHDDASNATQALGYQALFASLSDPACPLPVAAVFVFWIDHASTADFLGSAGVPRGPMWECGFTPRGKPAWDVLEAAFALPG